MAEIKNITFTHKEVAEALLRQQGITEGIWGIWVEFGFKAANVGTSETEILPAVIAPIQKLGLQRFSEENNLTVDASKLASRKPKKRGPARKRAKKKARATRSRRAS